MALTYTVSAADIHAGTSLALGVASLAGEGGVRRFLVEVTSNVNEAEAITGTKLGAIQKVNTDYTTHEISGLPLQRTVATRIGPKRFIVDQFWGWGSDAHWGGTSANTLADFDVGPMGVQCFTCGTPDTADGLPSVTISGSTVVHNFSTLKNMTCPPQPYQYPIVLMKLRIPFRSNISPMTSAVEALVGYTNSETCKILSGIADPASHLTFTAGKMRFDGARVTARANSSYAFIGFYEFSVRRAWSQMNMYWDVDTLEYKFVKTVYLPNDTSHGTKFRAAFGFVAP